MLISIANPIQSTVVFSLLLFVGIFFFLRTKKDTALLPLSTTQELKGLAILLIIFSHIGYFLASDHRFLFPLSIIAGVGVDLFLFLSAFGLTMSQIKKSLSPKEFYLRRLLKLFPSFWIVFSLLVVSDFIFLHIVYPRAELVQGVFGIFTHADIYKSINSPFWYFTWILFFYLLFPIVFSRKSPWASAIGLYVLARLFVLHYPPFFESVVRFYLVHTMAFPLGVFVAWIFSHDLWRARLTHAIHLSWLREKPFAQQFVRWLVLLLLLSVIVYTSYYSGVGTTPEREQYTSLCTMGAFIFLFLFKKIESRLLILFGLYSYEIYLLHWPLMYRYDFLYSHFPAEVATALWLCLLVMLGWGLQYITRKIGGKV